MRQLVFAILALMGISASTEASAVTLLYKQTAVASGVFGGQAFTDAQIILSGLGETDNVVDVDFTFSRLILPVSIEVAGLGSGQFTNTTIVGFNKANGGFFFSDLTADLLILGTGVGGAPINLRTPFGPITNGVLFNPGTSFATTGGGFRIDVLESATASSTLAATAVPDPSTWILMIFGFGLVSAAMRRETGAIRFAALPAGGRDARRNHAAANIAGS